MFEGWNAVWFQSGRESLSQGYGVARAWNWVEKSIAIILIALCLGQTGRMMRDMATTSLWTDEFGAINTYSSRGPAHVMKTYFSPKNHLFFDLINSVLPGRDSLNPARARAVSIVAAGLFALILIGYSVFRRALFEGAAILTLWSFSRESLVLCLQARGYGLLALAALVATICVSEYLRTNKPSRIYVAAAVVALGTYTVPGFLFFGGPLLLLVWLFRPKREPLLAGIAAVLAIALLYSPVALKVFAAFHTYAEQYGENVRDVQSIITVFRFYFVALPDWGMFLLLIGLGVAPLWIARREPGAAIGGEAVAMASTLLFFAILLYIRSAPERMTNMAIVPFAVAGIFALGAIVRAQSIGVQIVCFGLGGVALLASAVSGTQHFKFVPYEDYILGGKVIDQAFPADVQMNFVKNAKYLKYTVEGPHQTSSSFDEASYLAGKMAVADLGNRSWSPLHFTRPTNELHNASIVVPGALRDLVVTFQIPSASHLDETPPEITDRNSKTGLPLANHPIHFLTEPASGSRSLVLLTDHAVAPSSIEVTVDGSDDSKAAIYGGNAIVVPLAASGHASTIEIKNTGAPVSLVEAWAVEIDRAIR